jgi:hypothetical protein
MLEGVLPEWLDQSRAGWGKILDTLSGSLEKNGAPGAVEP